MKELINLLTAIYFTYHKKQQLVEFKEVSTHECKFQNLHFSGTKTKRMSALALKFSYRGNYFTKIR